MPDSTTDRPPTPARVPRIPPLDCVERVRIEAGRLYRCARRGEIEPSDASKLGTILALIARLIEQGDFEARLAALEARHENP